MLNCSWRRAVITNRFRGCFVVTNSIVLNSPATSVMTGYLFRVPSFARRQDQCIRSLAHAILAYLVPSIWPGRNSCPVSRCLLGTCNPCSSCRLTYRLVVYLKYADNLPHLSSWLWCYLFSASSSWVGKQFLYASFFNRNCIWHTCNGIHPPGNYIFYNDSTSYLWRRLETCCAFWVRCFSCRSCKPVLSIPVPAQIHSITLGCIFSTLGNFDCLAECQLFLRYLEDSFEDCFIANGTDESCPHCLILWILDYIKVRLCSILPYPSYYFWDSLSWLTLHLRPEHEKFLYKELSEVVLLVHESHNLIHCQVLYFFRCCDLCCQGADELECSLALICQEHFMRPLSGHWICLHTYLKPGPIILP